MQGLFFTGTDTGVGKTYVTAAVARLLRQQGRRVRVCKPVATGAVLRDGTWIGEDTLLLAQASGETDLAAVTPWLFPEPAAPTVAARLQGTSLHLEELAAGVQKCYASGTVLLVEGIGGLLCPLTDNATVAELATLLGLPLVVVARCGLGTLNHTLLTLEVAARRGLRVAGVVVSETTPLAGVAEENSVQELQRLGVPLLAVMTHGAGACALDGIDWWKLATGSQ